MPEETDVCEENGFFGENGNDEDLNKANNPLSSSSVKS